MQEHITIISSINASTFSKFTGIMESVLGVNLSFLPCGSSAITVKLPSLYVTSCVYVSVGYL